MKKKVLVILLVFVMACCTACGLGETSGDKEENTRTEKEDKFNKDKHKDAEEKEEQEAEESADVEEQAEDVEFEAESEDVVAVGEIITFGNDTYSNEWIILDRDGDKLFILNKYAVKISKFHNKWEEITWETSELRSWLNNDYFNEAFSESERALIQQTYLVNDDNPQYGTEGGNDTTDYIFILSANEVINYLGADQFHPCTTPDGTMTPWWLRVPGRDNKAFTGINIDGGVISYYGTSVFAAEECGVRPAMWIDASALK